MRKIGNSDAPRERRYLGIALSRPLPPIRLALGWMESPMRRAQRNAEAGVSELPVRSGGGPGGAPSRGCESGGRHGMALDDVCNAPILT